MGGNSLPEVGGVGGVGRVPAGVQLRLLWRQAAQVGTGAVAGGAAGVGGGDVAPEARGGYGWLWVAMGGYGVGWKFERFGRSELSGGETFWRDF